MEKVKAIAWWVVATLFLLWTLAAFPSLGCLFFLIGAAVSAPVPAVRDFWDEKGLRGAPKVALAVALLIAGSVAAQDRFAERDAEKEPPSETAEIVEAAPSADAESVPGEGETAPEAFEESAPPEIEIPENAILLVAGEKGEYGKWTAMNKETFYAYYLPGGVYSVTNAGEYPTQVSVYEGIQWNMETGFDEYSATGDILRLEVGETGEIAIPDGWFVEIHEPTKAAFVRTGDVPEPEPAEETGASVEESAQSPESLVEFLDTQYSALGMENYEVAYEDGAFIIRLWEPGLTGIATRMANGGEGIPEDLTAEYESWTNTATSLSDSAHKLIKESGRNEDVRAYILNEWNHENVIFCAVNGVVSYDVAHGITW